jgi:hypothetical protein
LSAPLIFPFVGTCARPYFLLLLISCAFLMLRGHLVCCVLAQDSSNIIQESCRIWDTIVITTPLDSTLPFFILLRRCTQRIYFNWWLSVSCKALSLSSHHSISALRGSVEHSMFVIAPSQWQQLYSSSWQICWAYHLLRHADHPSSSSWCNTHLCCAFVLIFIIASLQLSSSMSRWADLHRCAVALIFIIASSRWSSSLHRRALIFIIASSQSSSSLNLCSDLYRCVVVLIFLIVSSRSSLLLRRCSDLHCCAAALIFIIAPVAHQSSSLHPLRSHLHWHTHRAPIFIVPPIAPAACQSSWLRPSHAHLHCRAHHTLCAHLHRRAFTRSRYGPHLERWHLCFGENIISSWSNDSILFPRHYHMYHHNKELASMIVKN